MVYELNEMIDYLDKFFDNSTKSIIVGGVAGTQIEKLTISAATRTTKFSRILVVNGCQDYVGLMKEKISNVVFWADVFYEEMVDPVEPCDSWRPSIFNPKTEYVKRIDTKFINSFDIMLVFNAELIPYEAFRLIDQNFSGKIVYVTDPIDINSCMITHCWCDVHDIPVITDSLEKTSPMIAMARSLFGISTRAIDRKVKGSLNQISKLSKRSIGKLDDKQYFTNDAELFNEVINRQMQTPFRKHQKVVISDDRAIEPIIENGCRKATLVEYSMLVLENPNKKPLMLSRLYNSKTIIPSDLQYDVNGRLCFLNKPGKLNVYPANIMYPHDARYHRFNHSVFVRNTNNPSCSIVTKEMLYTIFKNSNSVTLVGDFSNIK